MRTYLLPVRDVMGKAPVGSVYTTPDCLVTWCNAVNTACVLALGCVGGVGTFGLGLVERRFLRWRSRCPNAVWMDLGRCCLTALVVKPGQEWKCCWVIASHHVEGVGLNAAWWRYLINSDWLVVVYAERP